MKEILTRLNSIDKRQARIESRLVQLMLFLGADPAERYTPPTCGKEIDGTRRTERKLRIDDDYDGASPVSNDGSLLGSIKRRFTGSKRG